MGSDNFPRKFGGDDSGPLFDNKIPDFPRFCGCGKPTDIALVVVREKRGPRREFTGAASEFSNHDKHANPNWVLRDIYEFVRHQVWCAECYLAMFPPPVNRLLEMAEEEGDDAQEDAA